MIMSALGTLTQPLFYRGANLAKTENKLKAQQEIAALNFQQSILNAGSEVSNALLSISSS